jgi:hypothetical protein
MNHLPWMLERGTREPCGHALMASCPPELFSELTPDIPFGQQQQHNHSHAHHLHPTAAAISSTSTTTIATISSSGSSSNLSGNGMTGQAHTHAQGQAQGQATATGTWQLSKSDLATLLDLSKKLNLDGEITPVMAWGMVLAHPRVGELKAEDFARLAEELAGKIRCYG